MITTIVLRVYIGVPYFGKLPDGPVHPGTKSGRCSALDSLQI